MPTVSILIPNRSERWLQQTVDDLLAHAETDVEIIVVHDGAWPDPPLRVDKRVSVLHWAESHGMRASIEAAAEMARGKWFLKIDAHCSVGPGFDKILMADCDDNWIAVPRRYSLDVGTPEEPQWRLDEKKKHRPIDAHYLCFPYREGHDVGLHGEVWDARTRARMEIPIDDEMSSQGSCWFMSRDHFWKRMGGMPLEGYGRFVQEFQQIGMKTWMGGGRCVVNKKTWYSHLHKGKAFGRGYYISKPEMILGAIWSADWWTNDRWPARTRNFEWLVDHFSPIPTWPENWRDVIKAKTPRERPVPAR